MTDIEPTDEILLARFRGGDSDAFRQLVAPHLPALHARAKRWLDGRLLKKVSLRDVVQDAQVIAFERRATFEKQKPDSFLHWLLAIVDNCARTTIGHYAGTQKRETGRELTGEHRPATSAFLGREPSPSNAAADAEQLRLLLEARATLKNQEQEILRLVHDEQLALTDVAARMNRPYEAVKKQHARALLKLGRAFHSRRST